MYFQKTDKMDKLEEFIRKNREDMDMYTPSEGVWNEVKRKLRKQNISVNKWLSIAAMVVVILCTGIILIRIGDNKSASNDYLQGEAGLEQANPHLKETEIYYNNLVNSLYHEATPLLTGNPEIKKELNADISQLDSICSDIKKDLKDNVANQEVVEALIQNYRIKIRLLEDMLAILKENENNPEKIKSHEL
jgi:hypothetical protein